MLAVPVRKGVSTGYDDMKFFIVRYKIHRQQLIFATGTSEYADVRWFISKKYGKEASGMYASNSVYEVQHPTLSELNQPENVTGYMAMIDIDNVFKDPKVGHGHLYEILTKLYDVDPWLLISGSGIHVKINGFRSAAHARTFIESREIREGYVHKDSPIKVDLLNDVSRIGTVPYEVYKKDKNILCFPFMPNETHKVFDRPDWRVYFKSREITPWKRPASDVVREWNKRDIPQIRSRFVKPRIRRRIDTEDEVIDSTFWKSIPPCVKNAFHKRITDGRMRTISFLATYLNKIGIPEDIIIDNMIIRGATFPEPLDSGEVDRVTFEVIDRELESPGCSKVRSIKGKNPYPYAYLGHLNLCPYGPNLSHGCAVRNPVDMFVYNQFYNRTSGSHRDRSCPSTASGTRTRCDSHQS